MSSRPGKSASRGLLVDIRPLRESPAFARLWAGNLISGLGAEMTLVAVGIQVYALTHSTLAVSLVGVFGLLPLILAGLYGGMLADAFDRRTVLITASLIAWAATIGIATLAWLQVELLWPLYALSMLNSVAATVIGIGRSTIIARLVRRELLPAVSALNGISGGLYVTVGPALGGALVAVVGFGWTYTADVVLFLASLLASLSLSRFPPEGAGHGPGIRSIVAGMTFLRGVPALRVSFIADLIAMTFGRTNALFPAVGALIIGGGAMTVGALTAAEAVGALLLSIFSGRLTAISRHGLAVGWAIALYGACILGFGIVLATAGPHASATHILPVAFVLAVIFIAGAGATDNVSAIFRSTIMQAAAPDNLRGRVQGIYTVVVNAGPRLGDLFVGTLATVGALWAPPLLGGIVIIAAMGIVLRTQRQFRRYDGAATPAVGAA